LFVAQWCQHTTPWFAGNYRRCCPRWAVFF